MDHKTLSVAHRVSGLESGIINVYSIGPMISSAIKTSLLESTLRSGK